jgi:hypothetical protein
VRGARTAIISAKAATILNSRQPGVKAGEPAGEPVVVIAGYRKQMDAMMSHNEGLPSRFPHHFTFEDYSDEELTRILRDLVISCPSLQKLEDLRGLQKVKTSIKSLIKLVQTNAELEDAEKPLKKVTLNRVFVGNPGTGKTTLAKLYWKIRCALGMLSKEDVIVKTPQDFIGEHLGQSEKNTKAILDVAKGCVLVIDEAYGLTAPKGTADPYRTAVIDTIVAEVHGIPGDDRCVLPLGYKDNMSEG